MCNIWGYLKNKSSEADLLSEVKQNAYCHLSLVAPNKLSKTSGTFRLM